MGHHFSRREFEYPFENLSEFEVLANVANTSFASWMTEASLSSSKPALKGPSKSKGMNSGGYPVSSITSGLRLRMAFSVSSLVSSQYS
jgi:hypothetical protein